VFILSLLFPLKLLIILGAGDVFIGTLAYGLVNKLSVEKMLKLASFVAGHKCTVGGGAQKGIPFLNQVPQELRN